VRNCIHIGCSLLLPVGTENPIQTRKVLVVVVGVGAVAVVVRQMMAAGGPLAMNSVTMLMASRTATADGSGRIVNYELCHYTDDATRRYS
jgi:hypothetical protein